MDRITFSALVRVWEYYFQIYIIIIFVFIYRNIINIKFLNVKARYCNPIKIWEDIKGSYVFEKKRGAQSDQCNLNKKSLLFVVQFVIFVRLKIVQGRGTTCIVIWARIGIELHRLVSHHDRDASARNCENFISRGGQSIPLERTVSRV